MGWELARSERKALGDAGSAFWASDSAVLASSPPRPLSGGQVLRRKDGDGLGAGVGAGVEAVVGVDGAGVGFGVGILSAFFDELDCVHCREVFVLGGAAVWVSWSALLGTGAKMGAWTLKWNCVVVLASALLAQWPGWPHL